MAYISFEWTTEKGGEECGVLVEIINLMLPSEIIYVCMMTFKTQVEGSYLKIYACIQWFSFDPFYYLSLQRYLRIPQSCIHPHCVNLTKTVAIPLLHYCFVDNPNTDRLSQKLLRLIEVMFGNTSWNEEETILCRWD